VRAEITFNGDGTAASRYVGWVPVPAQVRLSDPTDASGPITVSLQNQSTTQGGQVVFFSAVPGTAQDDLDLTLPLAGTPVQFFLAGRFQRPSSADGDVNVQIVNTANSQAIGTRFLNGAGPQERQYAHHRRAQSPARGFRDPEQRRNGALRRLSQRA
jgi:hypothetical protein